jgi:hypothetical protein
MIEAGLWRKCQNTDDVAIQRKEKKTKVVVDQDSNIVE